MFNIALVIIIGVMAVGGSIFLNLALEGRDEREFPVLTKVAKWSLRVILVVCLFIIWKYDLWC